jgi:hypothetical protein
MSCRNVEFACDRDFLSTRSIHSHQPAAHGVGPTVIQIFLSFTYHRTRAPLLFPFFCSAAALHRLKLRRRQRSSPTRDTRGGSGEPRPPLFLRREVAVHSTSAPAVDLGRGRPQRAPATAGRGRPRRAPVAATGAGSVRPRAGRSEQPDRGVCADDPGSSGVFFFFIFFFINFVA